MSSVVIAGDISGSVTLQAPHAAGTTTLTLPAVSGTILTSTSTIAATNVTGVLSVSQGGTGVTTAPADVSYTGTGATVRNTNPVLVAPTLGTPVSGNLSNCTGFPTAAATTTGVTAASGTNTTQLATTAFAYGTLSTAASGYTKLANGLIIQWGSAYIGGNSNNAVNYATTFPTASLSTTGSGRLSPHGTSGWATSGAGTNNTSSCLLWTTSDIAETVWYIAIGY
jgi:hypothetical protein